MDRDKERGVMEENTTNRVQIIKHQQPYNGVYYDVDIRSKDLEVDKIRDLVLDTLKRLNEEME